MKYYGDIPEEHLLLIEELEKLENWFREYGDSVPALSSAKGFVCMAHDWYDIDMEEKGDLLLKEAEKLYPGYFKGPIYVHMSKDEDFDLLVSQIKKTVGLDLMYALGFGK